MLLVTIVNNDGKQRHFDAEQATLKTNIDEEICLQIPKMYQEFPGAVELLNKAIYGLVQAGGCRKKTFYDVITAIGCE